MVFHIDVLHVIGSLSNGDIFTYLHGPLTRFSRSWHFFKSQISRKNGVSCGQSYHTTVIVNHM